MLIVVDPPFLFRTLWKVLSAFIDETTKKKILFVSGNDAHKRKLISEFIDLSQVQKNLFAGDSSYTFDPAGYMQMLRKEESFLPPK